MRESRGKAKQYTTINGRTVVVKDAYVYSNKGAFLVWRTRRKLIRSCRIQNSQPSTTLDRYTLVPGFVRAKAMAHILHLKAFVGRLRGGQDYTCDYTEVIPKWPTIFAKSIALSNRIPNFTKQSSQEKGYQVL